MIASLYQRGSASVMWVIPTVGVGRGCKRRTGGSVTYPQLRREDLKKAQGRTSLGFGIELAQDFAQRAGQAVDVGFCVERPGTDPNGPVRERAQRAVDVRGAVQARADRDVERLVEDAAEVAGRQGLAAEAECADVP